MELSASRPSEDLTANRIAGTPAEQIVAYDPKVCRARLFCESCGELSNRAACPHIDADELDDPDHWRVASLSNNRPPRDWRA